jgi:dsDNA-specific endonuclease/ATPase MutS2
MYKIPEVDLHDTDNTLDALDILEREIFLIYKKGGRQCRIIHGIGAGILAGVVHGALQKNPLIKKREESEDGGSCFVYM